MYVPTLGAILRHSQGLDTTWLLQKLFFDELIGLQLEYYTPSPRTVLLHPSVFAVTVALNKTRKKALLSSQSLQVIAQLPPAVFTGSPKRL